MDRPTDAPSTRAARALEERAAASAVIDATPEARALSVHRPRQDAGAEHDLSRSKTLLLLSAAVAAGHLVIC